MTRDEFLIALRATPREGWRFILGASRTFKIRRVLGNLYACPIEAINGPGLWTAASTRAFILGLSRYDTGEILVAADGFSGCNRQLRAQLIEAVGLPPEGK